MKFEREVEVPVGIAARVAEELVFYGEEPAQARILLIKLVIEEVAAVSLTHQLQRQILRNVHVRHIAEPLVEALRRGDSAGIR